MSSSISFNCPWCGGLCAFKDEYAGQRARCLECRKPFFIPAQSNQPAEKIEEVFPAEEPLPGFYKAAFIGGGKMLKSYSAISAVAWLVVLVLLKFFLGNLNGWISICWWSCIDIYIPFGYAIQIITAAFVLKYLAQIIRNVGFDIEVYPHPDLEFSLANLITLWMFLIPAYKLALTLLVVWLPACAVFILLKITTIGNYWIGYLVMAAGMYFWPMAVILFGATADYQALLQMKKIYRIPFKAPVPYLITAAATLAGVILFAGPNVNSAMAFGQGAAALALTAKILSVPILLFSGRMMGVFYRHYHCYIQM